MEKLPRHSMQLDVTITSPKKRKYPGKFGLLISCVILYPILNQCCAIWMGSAPIAQTTICEQPQPAAKSSNLSKFVEDPEFWKAASERLAGAVRIPTMCVFLECAKPLAFI